MQNQGRLKSLTAEHAAAAEKATVARSAAAKANELVEQLQRSAQRAEAGIEDNDSSGTITEQIMGMVGCASCWCRFAH